MENKYSYKNITCVYTNFGTTTIPSQVFEGSQVIYKELDLSGNLIEELDDKIAQLTTLRTLNLANNQLKELPNCFELLTNLEVLNLANNKLEVFPVILTKLPQLKILNLKGNSIKELPAEVKTLVNLTSLELGFNPLEGLPNELSKLKALKYLSCTSNRFDTFPEVLLNMEYLEDLKRLDLEFRLKLSNQDLKLFFKILRHLKKQKASLATKKAAFALFFATDYQGEIADVLPLLLVNYVAFSQMVRNYIVTTYHSKLTDKSKLAILGKTEWIDADLCNTLVDIVDEVQADTTHVVLGRQINKRILNTLHDQLYFVSEKELLAFLSPKQPADWLIEHKEKIVDLLMSGQNENIALALQLAKNNELLDEMLTELLMAYTLVTGDAGLRNNLRALFYRKITNFEKITLPNASFQFYTPNKSEHAIFQGIQNITNQTEEWSGLKIAHYLFDRYQVAYTYILEYSNLEAAKTWLGQFVVETTLSLGKLSKLKKLPDAVVLFPQLSSLDLRGCGFRKFPNMDLLNQLPNLEEIDLRENPIAFIPRNLFDKVAKYRILLSK